MILLESNLSSESRLLRLSTMRVLARYDPLRFGEHGDSGGDAGRSSAPRRNQDDEACNFLEVAEAVEALPISIAAERDLMWRLGQLEVLGRSDRLPRPYARLMATHALGLLRVKFSGVWPRAAAIIGALSQRPQNRELVWDPIHRALRKVVPPPATRQVTVVSPPRAPAAEVPREKEVPSGGGVQGTQVNGGGEAGLETQLASGNGGDNGMDIDDAPSVTPFLKQSRQEQEQEQPSGLRVAVPPPQPWIPRLLPQAAVLDGGPTEEMDLPVCLLGVFLDETVRTGLQPESGEVPLWASTDADSAFAQVLLYEFCRGFSRAWQAIFYRGSS